MVFGLIKNSKSKSGYLLAVVGIGLTTALLAPFHANLSSATVSLALLIVVLAVATVFGSRPALVASVLGVLCFNFFFLPPLYTFTIAESQNWVAFAAFFITAVVAGQLSSYARRRAEESESRRLEIERLYRELQTAFEQASQAEALRRSEKLKSALLDAVTHDLRSPLTSIKTSVTTLLNDDRVGETEYQLSPEERRDFHEIINEDTDRLNHFIEGMVELARIEAGELILRPVWSEAGEIVQAALLRAEPLLENYRIKLFLEDDLPLVRADSKLLSEVLYALLENVSKYVPEKTEIEISVRRAPNETIEFAVADEGEGVPENLRERIFDKFFRVTDDGKISRRTSGSGLGLAIAKGIVEAHQGKIRVADREKTGADKGAKFIFVVPIGDE